MSGIPAPVTPATPAAPTPAAPAAPLPSGVPAAPPTAAAPPAAPAAPAAPPAEPAKSSAPPAEPAKPSAPPAYAFKDATGQAVDTAVTKAYAEVAGKHGIAPEAAQEIFNQVMPALQKQMADQATEARKSWLDASMADPEFGGDKLKGTLELTSRVFALGRPTLGAFLKETGLDNHPELVAWAAAVGKRLSPDALAAATPTNAPATPKSPADGFYPTMKRN